MGDVRQRLVVLEVAVGAEAAGMHHALRDAFVVEVEDLLAEVEILQQGRTARADPQGVLVVGDRDALLRGQHRHVAAGDLVGLAALAALDLGIGDRGQASGGRHWGWRPCGASPVGIGPCAERWPGPVRQDNAAGAPALTAGG